MDDKLRSIQEYVYAKYIEGSGAPPIDEVDAVAYLEQYFAHEDRANDPDCFYVGIICFELGYEMEERQEEFFRKAKYYLERHRALTGEEWDAIDDRLLDLDEYFAERGIEVESAPLPEQAEPPMAPVGVKEIEDHGPMMLVAGGSFLFGPENQKVNEPAFYIDKFPVTNREYEAFCRATGYRFPKYWGDKRFNNPEAPVVGVSVADAQKFSRWVGKQLPSEAQWEKACRGIDGRVYPWGDDDVTDERACHGQDPAEGGTHPVTDTTESDSPYGVRDLVGNVWEWTSSTLNDIETVNVIKGGCYNDPPGLLVSHLRLEAVPKDKFETIGFRCVKSA